MLFRKTLHLCSSAVARKVGRRGLSSCMVSQNYNSNAAVRHIYTTLLIENWHHEPHFKKCTHVRGRRCPSNTSRVYLCTGLKPIYPCWYLPSHYIKQTQRKLRLLMFTIDCALFVEIEQFLSLITTISLTIKMICSIHCHWGCGEGF